MKMESLRQNLLFYTELFILLCQSHYKKEILTNATITYYSSKIFIALSNFLIVEIK